MNDNDSDVEIIDDEKDENKSSDRVARAIDFGTTNTVWAMIPNEVLSEPIVQKNLSGDRTTPTRMMYDGESWQFGKNAKINSYKDPKNAYHDVKRLIGKKLRNMDFYAFFFFSVFLFFIFLVIFNSHPCTKYVNYILHIYRIDEAKKIKTKLSYDIVAGKNGQIEIKQGDETYKVDYMGGKFLAHLKSEILPNAKGKPDVVISAPAYFTNAQRNVVRSIGIKLYFSVSRNILKQFV